MKNKTRLLIASIPLVLLLGVVCGVLIGIYVGPSTGLKDSDKLRNVLALVQNEYVDEIDIDSLVETSIPDLLASLDPHSVYIPKVELTAANDELEGSFSGVGISFQLLDDSLTVVEVIPGGPAEKVGILAGDRILRANGKVMTGTEMTTDSVMRTLRGPKDSKVLVEVKRSGVAKPLKFDIIRGDIPVNSVDAAYMLEEGIGYIKVSKFAKNTAAEFLTALGELKQKGARKFVVDLRGNSGGFMEQAILMVNEFLPQGRKIVYTQGRNPQNNTDAVSDGYGNFQDSELVVLTDEGSASASEIFAGAIQDNDRGLVIGRRTFGKGLVQNQIMLPDSSAVRLTVARYYTPSGRSIQKEYQRGADGKYELDIVERYNHGEFYNVDSIKLDKKLQFKTVNGRTVYGGGGIMPDIFVPVDTAGYTSYYMNVMNQGLVQKYSFNLTDRYRNVLSGVTTVDRLFNVVPGEDKLLQDFVEFAEENGEPSRWYYINQSRNLLLRQIMAVIARDALGYQQFYEILNREDPVVNKALEILKTGKSPVNIEK